MGLHRVENASHTDKAVSLHLYCPPFEECSTFNQHTGHETRAKSTFWSIRGEKVSKVNITPCRPCANETIITLGFRIRWSRRRRFSSGARARTTVQTRQPGVVRTVFGGRLDARELYVVRNPITDPMRPLGQSLLAGGGGGGGLTNFNGRAAEQQTGGRARTCSTFIINRPIEVQVVCVGRGRESACRT